MHYPEPIARLMDSFMKLPGIGAKTAARLAFFCMDMDYHRQAPLGHQFLQHYLSNFPGMETEEDQQLFLYYKLYRANVRLKVNALKWEQSTEPAEQKKRAEAVREYFYLMRYYAKAVFKPLLLSI